MATYHGKHSRPTANTLSESNGQSPLQDNTAANEPLSREQLGQAHARRSRVSRSKTASEGRGISHPWQGGTRAQTQDSPAGADAFQHHTAVQGLGKARHSKLKTLLIVIPLVVVLAAAAVGAFFWFSPLFAEEDPIEPGVAVSVTIPEGAGANEIAGILKDGKVVESVEVFLTGVQERGLAESLKPGTYELKTLMDLSALITLLAEGPVQVGNKLTIAEGLTVEQTAVAVEQACGISQADFLAKAYAASSYVQDFPFLEGAYNNSLEGFLYPKTYNVPLDATADTVVRILLEQYVIETSNLDVSYAEGRGLTLLDIVALASLIERETAAEEERSLVSSVIYNRLRDDMPLQIDATVVYALGPSYDGHPLTWEDLEYNSPYNTYLVNELPAGPICSPSIASLQAAAHPSETQYYYYVLTSTEGFHTFCETSEEFEVAKAEYMRVFGIA